MGKKQAFIILLCVLSLGLNGCDTQHDDKKYPTAYPASAKPLLKNLRLPKQPGEKLMQDDHHLIQIDYSNVNQGYVSIKRLKKKGKRIKIQLVNEQTKLKDQQDFAYYDLTSDTYEVFPLAYGDGTYIIKVFENVEANDYMIRFTGKINVKLKNEQIPYLYPNQTVNYDANSKTIQKAFALCENDDNDLKRIRSLYDFVINTIEYDDDKAEKTHNTYVLPVIDETLTNEKGICFDYAAMLAAMCRSQQIPCKVVVGDTEIEYHAWVEVWLDGTGWINPEVLLKTKTWSRMDPTFASSDTDYDGYYQTIYEY